MIWHAERERVRKREWAGYPKTKIPIKGGIRIGDYKSDDKWRCKTCKYLNEVEVDECTTCGDPRFPKKK